MENKVKHFAIHVDDIERAHKFYEKVYGWKFKDLGHPNFLQIRTKNDEIIGAIQGRNYSPVKDKVLGFECTVDVENVDEIASQVEVNGGEIVMPKTAIPGVGWIIKFIDSEGNLTCASEKDEMAK